MIKERPLGFSDKRFESLPPQTMTKGTSTVCTSGRRKMTSEGVSELKEKDMKKRWFRQDKWQKWHNRSIRINILVNYAGSSNYL